MPDTIRQQFEHIGWAYERLRLAAARLSPDALDEQPLAGMSSITGTLGHAINAEASWMSLIEIGTRRRIEPHADFEAVAAAWERQSEATAAYLRDVTSEELDRSISSVVPRSQQRVEYTVREVLSHVAGHHAQHRAEVAALITHAGINPGELGLMDFLLEPQGVARRAGDLEAD